VPVESQFAVICRKFGPLQSRTKLWPKLPFPNVLSLRVLAVCLLALLASERIGAQVTSNVLGRVLNIRVNTGTKNEGTATAFTLDVDGREYLLTAKHVVAGLKDKDLIEVSMNSKWTPLSVSIFRCDDPVDIAVLIPPHQLTVNFDLTSDQINFYLGQEAYFLGFPYGIESLSLGSNGPYPLPIVKHGTFSGLHSTSATGEADQILLDGYNNPGFSGGPIVYRDLNQNGVVFKLAGVISGFVPEVVPVMTKRDIKSPS
jgi:S1-C subfamily serine protease